MADLIKLDAKAGPLTRRYPALFGTYHERARACYGSRTLTFKGFVRGPEGIGGPTVFWIEPRWLYEGSYLQASSRLTMEQSVHEALFFQFGVKPGAIDPDRFNGRWVTVTGHFADAAASTCIAIWNGVIEGAVPSRNEAVAICETMFVVTSMKRTTAP